MTIVFSWQNLVSLCPASFCTPRSNLPVTWDISWLPTFGFQSPMMKMTSFFGVLVLEDLVGLHRIIQLQHYWLGHRLGLLWYWMVYLGNEPKSFCHFWDYTQVLHFRLFCWLWGLLHFFSKVFLLTIVDIMVIWIKFAHFCPLVHVSLKCQCSLLSSPVWPLPIYLDPWTIIEKNTHTHTHT